MEPISEHISWTEAVDSPTAARMKIDNNPTPDIIENMKNVAQRCFEPIRKQFGIPITIDSFYRCTALNNAVGGAAGSQHLTGQAIDFSVSDRDILDKMLTWAKINLVYDQLICEYPDSIGRPQWIHISFVANGKNRQQFITEP